MRSSQSNRQLIVAVKKIHHHDGRVWCGVLTPCEVAALVEDGYRFTHGHKETVARIKEKIARGEGGQTWYYFTLGRTTPADFPNKM